jgi:hypothetical protein
MNQPYAAHPNHGALLVLVLVFGAIFFIIVFSFMGFVITQSQIQERTVARERALAVAEAGLNYYKWFLAHNPNDVTMGTGVPGPYEVPFVDPVLGPVGTSSLTIASTSYCGTVSTIDITSVGYTAEDPSIQSTVYGRYAQPTVAEYAYIINSNVWAGADRTIIGPYHSNGAIRMDGTNNSTVSSGLENWTCDGSINCDNGSVSIGDTLPAVFGDGPNSALWNTGVPPISFAGLTVDLVALETAACSPSSSGICLPPSGGWGYRVEFKPDDTIDVFVVDRTWSHDEYATDSGWYTAHNLIRREYLFDTFLIDKSCPVIFLEDKVWLEGEVSTLVSLAAADNDTPGRDPDVILHDNITYSSADAGLLVIGEDDVHIGYEVPNDMELNGIFIAQNGNFGRNHYLSSVRGGRQYRNSLTINGTIVSNGTVGTKWFCGGYCSGFNTRFNSYDRALVDNPPPLAPNTSDDYKFIEWREMD